MLLHNQKVFVSSEKLEMKKKITETKDGKMKRVFKVKNRIIC